jgi:maleate isomerase
MPTAPEIAMPPVSHSSSEQMGLGIIVPSANTVLERDYPRLEIPNVSFHFSRILNAEDTEEQLSGMKALAGDAARLLAHTRICRGVAFACTSGSFLEGHGYDESIVRTIEAASGLPAVTTAGAVVDALHHLGIRRPMVFTPYEEWLSQRSVTFLESHGFTVSGHRWGFDMRSTSTMDDYESINEWIVREIVSEADAVFISCTNFSWLRGIAPLERQLGRPVITSNLATLWSLLKRAGLEGRLPDLSRLTS